MKALVSGVIMEVVEKTEINRQTEKPEVIVIAKIYQKGERSILDVKRVPSGYSSGDVVKFPVNVYPWANNRGAANLALSYDYDYNEDD